MSFYYHYTNLNAVKSIIENKELWLFSSQTMNDPNEFKNSLELLNNIFDVEILQDNSLSQNTIEGFRMLLGHINNTFQFNSMYSKSINDENILKKIPQINIFLCSFTFNSNDDLHQHIIYANQGNGVSLKFKININSPQANNEKGEREWIVLEMNYKKEYIQNQISKLFTEFLEKIRINTSNINENKNDIDLLLLKLLNSLIYLLLQYKNESYIYEKESRLINLYSLTNESMKNINFHITSNNIIKNYLKFNFKEKSDFIELKEIILGPLLNESINIPILEMLLEKNNFEDVVVRKTNHEYRG